MPIKKIEHHGDGIWGIWEINEKEEDLLHGLVPFENIPENLKHPQKRLEFLASRYLIRDLLKTLGKTYSGLSKNEFGKPFLSGNLPYAISLSHSYPYVTSLIHPGENLGIDLEQPHKKLFKVAPRVFSTREINDGNQDLVKLCIYWCAKESLIKWHGKKNLVLAEDLFIDSFSLQNSGKIIGHIFAEGVHQEVQLHYEVNPQFVLVFTSSF